MKYQELDLYIRCDGKPLPEYQVTVDDNAKTVTCFIPSEADKEFQIAWNSNRAEHLQASTHIDGTPVSGMVCLPLRSGYSKGTYVTRDQCRPLVFSKMVLVDDENLALDSAAINKLGSIEIEVTRVRNLGASNDTTHQLSVNGVGPVHEKSKKVGGHCVSYGKAMHAPSNWVRTLPLYPFEGIFAKFIFQYRPEALLRAQGIIERPKTPEPAQPEPSTAPIKRSRSVALSQDNKIPTNQERPKKKVKKENDDDVIDLTMAGEDPPKLLDPSLRGTVIDLTLDD